MNENVASGAGGGIANDGELTLLDTQLNDNQSGNVGGGIHSATTLTLRRCAINGNRSNGFSGGGVNNFGTLTVDESTFRDNIADSRGGAISSFRNDPAVPAVATVQNSTFTNNFGIRGGALSNFAATLTLLNSTVERQHRVRLSAVRSITSTGSPRSVP